MRRFDHPVSYGAFEFVDATQEDSRNRRLRHFEEAEDDFMCGYPGRGGSKDQKGSFPIGD
jgi:hypothetical protein